MAQFESVGKERRSLESKKTSDSDRLAVKVHFS